MNVTYLKMTEFNLDAFLSEYRTVSQNALSVGWIISPIDFFYPDGKKMFTCAFSAGTEIPRNLIPQIYKNTMQARFRATFLVAGYCKQPFAKTHVNNYEAGLCAFYQLNFRAAIFTWLPIVEGYTRSLFGIAKTSTVKNQRYNIPQSGNSDYDKIVSSLTKTMKLYLDGVLYVNALDKTQTALNRHLPLHGNIENDDFYSQENALKLLFSLDTLLFIEMAANKAFPRIINTSSTDEKAIKYKTDFYLNQLRSAFDTNNFNYLVAQNKEISGR